MILSAFTLKLKLKMKKALTGTGWILNSALFFASYGIWSRIMGYYFGEFSQAWTRGLLLLIFVLLLSWRLNLLKAIPRHDYLWFILIALAGGLNQAPFYFGFQRLPIGTATLIFYAALVIGGFIIGKLIFREKLSPKKIVGLIIALVGLSIIYQFSLSLEELLPAALVTLAGLMGAISGVLPKKLSADYHEFQIMIGYFTVMWLVNGLLSLLLGESLPPLSAGSAWLGQLGYASAMLIANFSVMEGFKRLPASVGSLIGMAEILFSTLFGLIFFGEMLSSTTLIGASLIIVGACLPNLKTVKK